MKKLFNGGNIKIKLISIMSAVVLWMYVMIIIDPEETRTLENVHVSISNMSKVREEDLIIYPLDTNITVRVNVTGKLSDIKSMSKDDISVFGNIKNPIEGTNEVHLTASSPQGIRYRFDERVIFVNLEKVIKEEKKINVVVDGKNKENISSVSIKDDLENITVTGARTLVEKVDRVEGYIDIGNSDESVTENVLLKPVDVDGNVVEGVSLEVDTVNVTVNVLKQKTVFVKLKIFGSNLSYDLENLKVDLKGEKQILDNLSYIETYDINFKEIATNDKVILKLKTPENVYLSQSEFEINTNEIPNLSKLSYTKDELKIKNNSEGKTLELPSKINVLINYKDIKPMKSDIELFVDLKESNKIQFNSSKNLGEVFIYPNSIN